MISLTPETERRLREQAERNGQDMNALADTLITVALSSSAFESDPDQLSEEQIAEIRAGIGRGLEAADSGRVKPLSQAVAEARQQHGFPSSWASGAW